MSKENRDWVTEKKLGALLAATSILMLAGCASSGSTWDAGQASRGLAVGMSESQVYTLIGGPNKTEMTTCGGTYAPPFPCKILTFGWSYKNQLRVYLQTVPAGAYVNSWNVIQF